MYTQSNTTLAPTVTAPRFGSSGLWYCLLAVVAFSVTLPATRVATRELDAALVGLGRGALGGIAALALLVARREPLPPLRTLRSLAVVALGVVLAFPLLTALALRSVPAHHAVLVVGLSPLATSAYAVVKSGERPKPAFWAFALSGALAVILGVADGQLRLGLSDGLLLLAVLAVAVGYAEGGRLAGELDGLRVTSWALVLALPVTLPVSVFLMLQQGVPDVSAGALACFAYVSFVSGLLAFWAWYRGLALGGVARGSQVQLLQPLLSLLFCALWLGESLHGRAYVGALFVLLSVAGTRWVTRKEQPNAPNPPAPSGPRLAPSAPSLD